MLFLVNNPQSIYLEDCWYRLDYIRHDTVINFRAYKIQSMASPIESSEIEKQPSMTGWIKWDGCMEFSYLGHYHDVSMAHQTYLLIEQIYKLKKELNILLN